MGTSFDAYELNHSLFPCLCIGLRDDHGTVFECSFFTVLVSHLLPLCNFRYFLRVTIVKRLSDYVKEQDIIVHTLSQYPEMNSSIKMEVGIEDCLHIEFEYNKSK